MLFAALLPRLILLYIGGGNRSESFRIRGAVFAALLYRLSLCKLGVAIDLNPFVYPGYCPPCRRQADSSAPLCLGRSQSI